MAMTIGQRVVSASGGTITNIRGYTVHTFTSSGSFTPSQSGTVEILVVGAGGGLVPSGGSPAAHSGGGGGSVTYRKFIPVDAGVSYSIEIGQITGPISTASTFTHPQGPITAGGGAAGVGVTAGSVSGISNPIGSGSGGHNGGSGGVGAGITGLGFPGASATSPPAYPGAGGGAGGAGIPVATTGNGGLGVPYSITGVSSYYGAGGAGSVGTPNNGVSLPQVSVYGRGISANTSPFPAEVVAQKPAGPGVVIIRYPS